MIAHAATYAVRSANRGAMFWSENRPRAASAELFSMISYVYTSATARRQRRAS